MTPLPSSRARALRVAALAVGILAAGIAPARADATPPVATAAAPAALAASSIVTFSEDVRNVTTANLLIRVTGTTDPLEAGISCRTRAGEPTSCSIGRVRVAHLNPRPVLLSGRKYTVVVNPSGASPIRDWSGNAARSSTMTFRAPVEQEETSPRATFSWRSVPDARAFGGSYRTDDTRGATSSFAFTGTSVTWYTVVGAGQGKALVAIDGVNRPEVNNYAERTSFRVARRYGGLGPGGHRITIRALGEKGSVLGSGASVAVDAFAVDGTHVTAPAVTYRWAGVSSASASGGRFARTDQPGARVRFAFFGKGIDWYTVTGPDQGSVDVFVDGTFRYRYDNYAGATAYGVRRGIAGLYEAVHAIVLVVRADRNELSTAGYVSIDRWYVRYPSISTFRRLGAWVDLYDYGSLDPSDAVADLDARGVRTLYLQTARYNTDADVAPVVGGWIERAHAAGMRVVGWYLPAYDEFMATDVRRTVAIARYSSPGGHRFDALAIDIEYRGKCETRE